MAIHKSLLKTLSFTAFVCFFVSFVWADSDAERVAEDASDIRPIMVGQQLPELTLKNVNGEAVNLNKRVEQRPSVLIFYRGGWCPYCNRHLGELKTIETELKSLGYQILAISPDRPENLANSADEQDINYTLLSDNEAAAAKALGLAFRVDQPTFEKYVRYGINIEKASGQTHRILPAPAAIIVDQEGIARFVFVSPDYKVRVEPSVLLAAAKSVVAE